MKILVAYASRHGATRGIAERIAQTLERRGLEVTLQPADQAAAVDEYDAFVIGSAAYIAHWLKEATNFVRRNRSQLAGRPVWLFGFIERLGAPFMRKSAVREALPAGDFRDWPEIEAWAAGIARELQRVEAPTPALA